MTKDVLISISGIHMDDSAKEQNENEPIEVVTPAQYYNRNGKHYVIYEEVTEGVPGVTKNKIKITGNDCVEIIKSGVTNSHMIFEKNKKNLTDYKTPYGQMTVGVYTRNMEIRTMENCIDILLDYELDVNLEPLAESKIQMHIVSKNEGNDFIAYKERR